MKSGDLVRVKKCRDVPAALGDKVVEIVKTDELSIWVERRGEVYVLARSQVRRVR